MEYTLDIERINFELKLLEISEKNKYYLMIVIEDL